MIEYMFPVEYKRENPWDLQMIELWKNSGKLLLSFSFNRFMPKTLPKDPFYLYLYYSLSSSTDTEWKGRTRFKFHVIDTSVFQPTEPDILVFPSTLLSTIWFICDQYIEISIPGGKRLSYQDFRHPEGKNLGSCLRSSIAPAICMVPTQIIEVYPNQHV